MIRNDRAGNTFAERLRAAATGLYAAAERMGERLRGIAENVFAYATGHAMLNERVMQLSQQVQH